MSKYVVYNDGDGSFYLDENGNLHGKWYRLCFNFNSNGLARVARVMEYGGRWYFINENFENVGGPYLWAHEFASDGLAMVRKEDNKWYYINENCEEVAGPYLECHNFGSNELTPVKKEDKNYYYINKNFNEVSGAYKLACNFESNGLAVVKKGDGKWYYINENFQEVSEGYESEMFLKIEKVKKEAEANNASFMSIKKYLNGELELKDLPVECFEGENLKVIQANEENLYDSLILMAKTPEQAKKVEADRAYKKGIIQGKISVLKRLNQTPNM